MPFVPKEPSLLNSEFLELILSSCVWRGWLPRCPFPPLPGLSSHSGAQHCEALWYKGCFSGL